MSVQRATGLLVGLMAGDKNGGPVRMAVRLAESLVERGHFDRDVAIERYLNWFKGPPHDTERAYDTGAVFGRVFELIQRGVPADDAADTVQKQLKSAGINAAHRNIVLAAFAPIADADLATTVLSEAAITHRHPLSGNVAVAVNVLARALIRGAAWEDALSTAHAAVVPHPEAQRVADILLAAKEHRITEPGGNDGFAPAVLRAALFFLDSSSSFAEALEQSCAFAGALNYCPVLVGSLGGARWGIAAIPLADIAHATPMLRLRVNNVAEQLGNTWL